MRRRSGRRSATWRRRRCSCAAEQGGARFEHAGGLIAAAYRHRMSRALDPQLHTHVVAANLARGEDGRYTALHHPSLYRAARTAGYLYQSHLRSLVRERLGLEWGPVHKGAAELRRGPRGCVAGVLAAPRAGRGGGRRARGGAGSAVDARGARGVGRDRDTRPQAVRDRHAHLARGDHAPGRRSTASTASSSRRSWRARSSAATAASSPATGRSSRTVQRVGESELAEVLAGPTGLTERANTFDQGAVLREFAAAAPQGSRVDTVRAQVGRFIGRDDVLATRGRTFTSAELVAREAALIDAAVGRRGEGVAQLDEGAIDAGDREQRPRAERAIRPRRCVPSPGPATASM